MTNKDALYYIILIQKCLGLTIRIWMAFLHVFEFWFYPTSQEKDSWNSDHKEQANGGEAQPE